MEDTSLFHKMAQTFLFISSMDAAQNLAELSPHDLGGLSVPEKIDLDEKPKLWWERKIDALLSLLASKKVFNVSELRHNIEGLGDQLYSQLSYYEKWTISMSRGLLASHVISPAELDEALGSPPLSEEV